MGVINYDNAKQKVMQLLFMKKTMKEISFILAQYIMKHYEFLTLRDNDVLFIYKDGVYTNCGESIVKEEVQKILEGINSTHTTNEVIGHIKRLTFVDRSKFDEPVDKICLLNGILNIKTLKIEPHTPKIVFLNKINANYDKKANCQRFKKFVSEIVARDDILIIQELIGYCLLKTNKFQKAFMFNGSGDNGKSVLIYVIEKFLGEDNCTSVTLQKLEFDKFSVANLYGKLANICADLPSAALGVTENFKKITAGDRIEGEKKFQGSFYFRPYSKIINSANRLPEVTDESYAFFKRWIIVNFPNTFTIGKGKTDVNLSGKLTKQEELDGILNWAIEGLQRLVSNKKFSKYGDIEEIQEEYLRKSNSVAAFELDCIVYDSYGHISKSDLYVGYEKFCENENLPIESRIKFYKKFADRVRVSDYAVKAGDKLEHCWKGISWRESKLTKAYKIT